jgi:hypothetical protein
MKNTIILSFLATIAFISTFGMKLEKESVFFTNVEYESLNKSTVKDSITIVSIFGGSVGLFISMFCNKCDVSSKKAFSLNCISTAIGYGLTFAIGCKLNNYFDFDGTQNILYKKISKNIKRTKSCLENLIPIEVKNYKKYKNKKQKMLFSEENKYLIGILNVAQTPENHSPLCYIEQSSHDLDEVFYNLLQEKDIAQKQNKEINDIDPDLIKILLTKDNCNDLVYKYLLKMQLEGKLNNKDTVTTAAGCKLIQLYNLAMQFRNHKKSFDDNSYYSIFVRKIDAQTILNEIGELQNFIQKSNNQINFEKIEKDDLQKTKSKK